MSAVVIDFPCRGRQCLNCLAPLPEDRKRRVCAECAPHVSDRDEAELLRLEGETLARCQRQVWP